MTDEQYEKNQEAELEDLAEKWSNEIDRKDYVGERADWWAVEDDDFDEEC